MHAFISPSPFLGVASLRRRPRFRAAVTASVSPDVVVIGAGIAGLSTAYELAQKGASVRILTSPTRKPAANASAGMLAPEAENLSGDMLKLCRVSREMYPDFVRRLQRLTDVDVHYVSRNDFLVPSMTPLSGPDVLTGEALRRVEPALGPKVKAARRSLGDASVDSRCLMSALYEACIALGVVIEEEDVHSLAVAPNARSVQAVQTKMNRVVGGHYLIASGAWTGKLLPEIPIRPVKGQMLSLAALENDSSRLNHVLYGHGVYIVPKNDGNEFYVGATVEHAGFDEKITARGISHLLNNAIELVPKLAEYEIKETWSGLRPAAPDLLPVLGHSDYQNVSIASGYYRNGILLAPAASTIVAAIILGEVDLLPSDLRDLADKFSYQRFHFADEHDIGIQKDSHEKSLTDSESPNPKIGADEHIGKPSDADKVVKLWKIGKNGTNEPVYPSDRFLRGYDKQFGGSVDIASDAHSRSWVSESLPSPSQQSTSSEHDIYQGGEGFESVAENLENISGENDAYEDVMRKRENADAVMSRAMAANRAFGRNKSSLETDESVELSISEEEVVVFDAALKEGVEDMKRFEKHFDPNDPSVSATRAEIEKMELEAEDVGLPSNGVAVPSFAEGGSTPGESSEGYY